MFFFFFKQKTAYEMRISDWSSDVCSSDLGEDAGQVGPGTRLGEELAPELVAAQDLGDPGPLLLLAGVGEQRGQDDAHRHPAGDPARQGQRVARRLLLPHPLVGGGEALTAVLGGQSDAGVARLVDLALQGKS